MSHVSGPTSSMPGSYHSTDGAMCDEHPERLAYKRVQGETDSFGAEFHDMCEECYEQHKINMEVYPDECLSGVCDWCGEYATGLRKRRDFDEGMTGRIYDVCRACVRRENDRLQEELDYAEDHYDVWI